MTANVMADAPAACRAAGVDDLVAKPVVREAPPVRTMAAMLGADPRVYCEAVMTALHAHRAGARVAADISLAQLRGVPELLARREFDGSQ